MGRTRRQILVPRCSSVTGLGWYNDKHRHGRTARTTSPAWMINYLPSILWQRRYYVLVCLTLFAIAGVALRVRIAATYRSTATLLVQSQDLPTSLVDAPTNGAVEQRIARIREQVLSRGDLIQLIEQNDLYQTNGAASRCRRSSKRCATPQRWARCRATSDSNREARTTRSRLR